VAARELEVSADRRRVGVLRERLAQARRDHARIRRLAVHVEPEQRDRRATDLIGAPTIFLLQTVLQEDLRALGERGEVEDELDTLRGRDAHAPARQRELEEPALGRDL
jgi:hypothetical protein